MKKLLTSKRRAEILKRLEELLNEEHCSCCDQVTCDINAANAHGYTLWAAYLFDGCGAASSEFQRLFAELTQSKRAVKAMHQECSLFADSVVNAECASCGAVGWDIDPDDWHCDSCGKTHRKARHEAELNEER